MNFEQYLEEAAKKQGPWPAEVRAPHTAAVDLVKKHADNYMQDNEHHINKLKHKNTVPAKHVAALHSTLEKAGFQKSGSGPYHIFTKGNTHVTVPAKPSPEARHHESDPDRHVVRVETRK